MTASLIAISITYKPHWSFKLRVQKMADKYRDLTPEERESIVEHRRKCNYPLHAPPHRYRAAGMKFYKPISGTAAGRRHGHTASNKGDCMPGSRFTRTFLILLSGLLAAPLAAGHPIRATAGSGPALNVNAGASLHSI